MFPWRCIPRKLKGEIHLKTAMYFVSGKYSRLSGAEELKKNGNKSEPWADIHHKSRLGDCHLRVGARLVHPWSKRAGNYAIPLSRTVKLRLDVFLAKGVFHTTYFGVTASKFLISFEISGWMNFLSPLKSQGRWIYHLP